MADHSKQVLQHVKLTINLRIRQTITIDES